MCHTIKKGAKKNTSRVQWDVNTFPVTVNFVSCCLVAYAPVSLSLVFNVGIPQLTWLIWLLSFSELTLTPSLSVFWTVHFQVPFLVGFQFYKPTNIVACVHQWYYTTSCSSPIVCPKDPGDNMNSSPFNGRRAKSTGRKPQTVVSWRSKTNLSTSLYGSDAPFLLV